jgi:kumamolisin
VRAYRLGATLMLAAVLAAACASASPAAGRPPASGHLVASPPAEPLSVAIRTATHLGPSGHGTRVYLNFDLKTSQAAKLAALLASGRTVTPAEYAAEFGPEPVLVSQALALLIASGLNATWRPGSALIAADGPAPAASALLGVEFENYRLANGATFYAATGIPTLAPALTTIVKSVNGLDSYRQTRSYAVRPGGLKPVDVLAFYNLGPLHSRGLDGTGETILFPEIETLPKASIDDLNLFAKEFSLPAFDSILTVKHDPNWGTPMSPQGEAILDLEIAHEVAPNAKLVVYSAGPEFVFSDRAFDQLVTDHLGSIISESLGACEPQAPSGHRDAYSGIEDRAVAQGMTHFVASGDNGAYTCGEDQSPAASFPATLPTVTAVGGTTVFESKEGVYFKEAAWGSPINQSGTGGGPSQYYPLPDWQKSVQDPNGHGFRQVPDVAAAADPLTGFHIVFQGQDTQIGGTSAATPMWAGMLALINQDLKGKNLREVGFANPAIYWMGANETKLSAPPFHDVTIGNNLAYAATPGWDFVTGWGSPDGAAIDAAWVTYIKSGGA